MVLLAVPDSSDGSAGTQAIHRVESALPPNSTQCHDAVTFQAYDGRLLAGLREPCAGAVHPRDLVLVDQTGSEHSIRDPCAGALLHTAFELQDGTHSIELAK